MASLADRVKDTTVSTTTVLNLDGAPPVGFLPFSSEFVTGEFVIYLLEQDGGTWEIGVGLLTSGTPWTLTRKWVIKSSTGSARNSFITLVAGTKKVSVPSSLASTVGRPPLRYVAASTVMDQAVGYRTIYLGEGASDLKIDNYNSQIQADIGPGWWLRVVNDTVGTPQKLWLGNNHPMRFALGSRRVILPPGASCKVTCVSRYKFTVSEAASGAVNTPADWSSWPATQAANSTQVNSATNTDLYALVNYRTTADMAIYSNGGLLRYKIIYRSNGTANYAGSPGAQVSFPVVVGADQAHSSSSFAADFVEEGTFVYSYYSSDGTTNTYLRMVTMALNTSVGSAGNDTISLSGAIATVTTGAPLNVPNQTHIKMLTGTLGVISYIKSDNLLYARVFTLVVSTGAITLGAEVALTATASAGVGRAPRIARISNTKVLFGYQVGVSGAYGAATKLRVGNISGTTLTLAAEFALASGTQESMGDVVMMKDSTTLGACTYVNKPSATPLSMLTNVVISSSDVITAPNPIDVSATFSAYYFPRCIAGDASRVVVACKGVATYMKGRTYTITSGSVVALSSGVDLMSSNYYGEVLGFIESNPGTLGLLTHQEGTANIRATLLTDSYEAG